MDVTSEMFLAILKSALLGQKADLDEEILLEDWQKLFSMAGIHSVLPMFYEAVYASYFIAASKCTFCCDGKALGYVASNDADNAYK